MDITVLLYAAIMISWVLAPIFLGKMNYARKLRLLSFGITYYSQNCLLLFVHLVCVLLILKQFQVCISVICNIDEVEFSFSPLCVTLEVWYATLQHFGLFGFDYHFCLDAYLVTLPSGLKKNQWGAHLPRKSDCQWLSLHLSSGMGEDTSFGL